MKIVAIFLVISVLSATVTANSIGAESQKDVKSEKKLDIGALFGKVGKHVKGAVDDLLSRFDKIYKNLIPNGGKKENKKPNLTKGATINETEFVGEGDSRTAFVTATENLTKTLSYGDDDTVAGER